MNFTNYVRTKIYLNRNRRIVALATLLITLSTISSTAFANVTTWCQGVNIQDVICYEDGTCFVTTNGYGGSYYYLITATNPNKNQMVAFALSAYTAGSKVRFVFTAATSVSCSNVPQNTEIYGLGVTTIN